MSIWGCLPGWNSSLVSLWSSTSPIRSLRSWTTFSTAPIFLTVIISVCKTVLDPTKSKQKLSLRSYLTFPVWQGVILSRRSFSYMLSSQSLHWSASRIFCSGPILTPVYFYIFKSYCLTADLSKMTPRHLPLLPTASLYYYPITWSSVTPTNNDGRWFFSLGTHCFLVVLPTFY